jgi:hypothetical protein
LFFHQDFVEVSYRFIQLFAETLSALRAGFTRILTNTAGCAAAILTSCAPGLVGSRTLAGRATVTTFPGPAHAADTAGQANPAAIGVATAATVAITVNIAVTTSTFHRHAADAGNLEPGKAATRTARRTTGHASAACRTTA